MTIEILKWYLQGDNSGLIKASRDATAPVQGVEGGVKLASSAVKAFAGAAVVGIAIKGLKEVNKSASDLNEALNASNVVFQSSSGIMEDWGYSAARNAGLSRAEFHQMGAEVGSVLKGMGFGLDEAAGSTIGLTQRAADMASIFNTDVGDAMSAVKSALIGQSEPIRKYGVTLDAARVKAKAVEMGLWDGKGAIDNYAKAQSTMAIILEQTNDLQGDFANTSKESANATRIANAELENTKAILGQGTLPVMGEFYVQQGRVLGLWNELAKATSEGNMTTLEANIAFAKGVIAGDDYSSVQEDVKVAVEGVTSAHEDWRLGLYQTTEAVDDLNKATDENGKLIDEVSESTKKFTDELLFNKAAQHLSTEAALAFGRELGLVDEKTVALNTLLPILTEQFDANADGLIDADEAASGYTAALLALKNAAEKAAGDYNVNIWVKTHGQVPSMPQKGQKPIGFQHGGSFIVPPGFPNDSFLMGVTSGERVDVTPNVYQLNYTGMASSEMSITQHLDRLRLMRS